MTYRGQVKHGVIVLEGNPPLRDGDFVRVEPETQAAAHSGDIGKILKHAGAWEHVGDEVDRMLEDLRQIRQEEVEAQKRRPDPTL